MNMKVADCPFPLFPINLEHTPGGNYPPVKPVNRIVQRSAQIRSIRTLQSHPAIQHFNTHNDYDANDARTSK